MNLSTKWLIVSATSLCFFASAPEPSAAQNCTSILSAPINAMDAAYARRAPVGAEIAWPVPDIAPTFSEIEVGCQFRVNGVDAVPAFAVALRAVDPVAATEVPASASGRTFVMADTHGEYTIAAEMLQHAGVIDAAMSWSFGSGTVVVLGDVLDRGPNQTELLWLFYTLQGEAAAAGGQFHLLLGNHETMVLEGDLRYLNERYPVVAERLGLPDYSEVLGPRAVLGEWLRTRPAILKIGADLFMHGGLSPAFAESGQTLDQTNASVRSILSDDERARGSVLGSSGPLWYRGYFARDDRPAEVDDVEVEAILARFGARRIFVGHTVVPAVAALFGGKVIAVQVYPTREPTGQAVMEAVQMDGTGAVTAIAVDGTTRPLA